MSTKFDNDILTAYVLGEPLGDRERKAIEKALAEDETLKARVDAIRATADFARTALSNPEEAPALSEEQREAVLDEAVHHRRRRVPAWRRMAFGAAAAAGVIFVSVTYVLPLLQRIYMDALPQSGVIISRQEAPVSQSRTDDATHEAAVLERPGEAAEPTANSEERLQPAAAKESTPSAAEEKAEDQSKTESTPVKPDPAVQPVVTASTADDHYQTGVALYNQSKFTEALDEFNKTLALDSTMENAKLMVRRCEGKILAAAPKIEPTDLAGMTATIKQKRVDELKIEARTSLEHKKHSHAVSALEQVLLIHPDDKEAQRLLQEATVSAHDERIVDVEKVQPQEATTATDTSKPAPDPYDPAGARQFAVRLPADEDRVLAKANTPKEPNPFGDLETDVDPFALFDYSYGGGSASSKRKGGEVEKPPPPTVEERTLARVERRVKMDRPDDLFAEFDYSPGSGSAVAKGDHSGSTLRVGGKEQRVIANSIITQADARGDVTVGQNLEYRRFERLKALGYIGEDSNTGQWHFETRVRATPGNESYETIVENPFKHVQDEPLSTFSIDVDTASYSNVRRFLNQGQLPPKSAVRIEELVNYFDYDYTPPEDRETPFAAHVEVASCPWTPDHQLARVALKGWEMAKHERPATNLVFLVDVSGSMQPENKLPLLVQGMKALTRQLDERDRVAIAVYAGNSGLVLESTPGHERRTILSALTRLRAGGSTNGGEGIQLAYNVARENFIKKGVNRVILATDGDFNVGITDQGSLTDLIEREAKSGVFLTVLGFGMGNLKDSTLEQLADKGNGNYAYIDTFNEARKVLVKDLMGTLVTIAKDVKIQVEFNPANVAAYRLIGYENRMLAKEDFNDDTKDAGEIGAGHTVTALYELVPVGVALPRPGVDALRYGDQTPEPEAQEPPAHRSDELLLLKLRYKQPDGDTSSLIEAPVKKSEARAFDAASQDFKFASAVASFGMVLRDSKHRGLANYQSVLDWAEDGIGKDPHGYRTEFFNLVKNARSLAQ